MAIVDPRFDAYMASRLTRHDDDVLLEMEAEADRRGFPAVGRNVGVTLELLARSIGGAAGVRAGVGVRVQRVLVRPGGRRGRQVHCTDGDAANVAQGEAFLARAGLGDRVTWHVGDAVEAFAGVEGEWDAVFVDIDKTGYPGAWAAARERVRVGGLYLCDNTLSAGSWTILEDEPSAEAVRAHNAAIAEDERYLSTIVPTREGVLVALRVR